jgi:NADH dehydrogenase FAD-containing subunit
VKRPLSALRTPPQPFAAIADPKRPSASGQEGTGTKRCETRPFKYRDLGSAAYVARGRAVVSAGPLHLSGLPGWFVWLLIHIAFLTGFRNRITALLTWAVAVTRDA